MKPLGQLLKNSSVKSVLLKFFVNIFMHMHIQKLLGKSSSVLILLYFLFISFPSYYVWGTLVIVQIFDFRFLADLHILGSGESKKHKISMVSGCSLVNMLVY